MAKVKIQGHASGTGVLTVTAPNTSTDRTITLPDATGELLSTAGGEMTGNVSHGDNIHARFGTGNDLDIYHDGSHSYVKDNGTGMLIIDTNGDRVRIQAAGTEELANFNKDGSVELFYDNASKLSTTATGVAVTGGVAIGGTGTANTLDDYEEGTWTPTFSNSSGGDSAGTYKKIGSFVFCTGQISPSGGSAGHDIGGLPFTPLGSTGQRGGGSVLYQAQSTAAWNAIVNASSEVTFYAGSSAKNLGNGEACYFEVSYHTA